MIIGYVFLIKWIDKDISYVYCKGILKGSIGIEIYASEYAKEDIATIMSIKISVIVPVYNMEQYLPECLDSIMKQSLKEIEIIVINDGSTDDSLSILEKYANKYDNILVLTQENQGVGLARNKGIKHATGKYLSFMDPDDFYPNNDCLEALYNAAEKNNVSMCGGIIIQNLRGERTIYGDKKTRRFYKNKKVKVKDYTDIYWFQRYLFLTDMIKDNNIYFPAYKKYEDPPFLIKALECSEEFYGLNKEVYEHRAGHQMINYTIKISKDILCGVRDVFKLAAENNLVKIYENKLNNIYEESIVPFYKYSFCGNKEIDEIIEEIKEIEKSWIGDGKGVNLTKEKVEQVRKKSQEEYENVMEILSDDKKKIIYGAGLLTRDFMLYCKEKVENVVGIAVTEKPVNEKNKIAGFEIKQINDFLKDKEEVWVIIATAFIHQEEIERHLKQLGFKHIIKLDMKKMELAKACKE